eukprot:m.316412 g.316412  ORF g.316412 m.316412 type:complete len:176 (+) comp19678_c0_seq16:311-838(+)
MGWDSRCCVRNPILDGFPSFFDNNQGGETVTVLERTEYWWNCSIDGATGWVLPELLDPQPAVAKPPPPQRTTSLRRKPATARQTQSAEPVAAVPMRQKKQDQDPESNPFRRQSIVASGPVSPVRTEATAPAPARAPAVEQRSPSFSEQLQQTIQRRAAPVAKPQQPQQPQHAKVT